MIQSDKRPVQSDFANITDYSKQCPDGARKFFAFVHFTDDSTCLWSNIFSFNRSFALMLAIEKFGDFLGYISSIIIHEQD
ncbi:MAG: hypothetical protein HDS85_05480 [Bacteroidales bacterium]|nr:hypothetical protein [Bacteroidales bacterium]